MRRVPCPPLFGGCAGPLLCGRSHAAADREAADLAPQPRENLQLRSPSGFEKMAQSISGTEAPRQLRNTAAVATPHRLEVKAWIANAAHNRQDFFEAGAGAGNFVPFYGRYDDSVPVDPHPQATPRAWVDGQASARRHSNHAHFGAVAEHSRALLPRRLREPPVPRRRDRKSTRLNSSHPRLSRMPSSA